MSIIKHRQIELRRTYISKALTRTLIDQHAGAETCGAAVPLTIFQLSLKSLKTLTRQTGNRPHCRRLANRITDRFSHDVDSQIGYQVKTGLHLPSS